MYTNDQSIHSEHPTKTSKYLSHKAFEGGALKQKAQLSPNMLFDKYY